MKLIIAGGRTFNARRFFNRCIEKALINTDKREVIIISGCAKGADTLGMLYAHKHNMELWKYPADWNTHGKSAGYIRNSEMADNATHLIAFWDGKSKGTKHMIDLAKKKNLTVKIIKI